MDTLKKSTLGKTGTAFKIHKIDTDTALQISHLAKDSNEALLENCMKKSTILGLSLTKFENS